MKSLIKTIISIFLLFVSTQQYAQHHSLMDVTVNMEKKILSIKQEIEFFNQTEDTLTTLVLNDWNNAYSSKKTPLAKRFSDEFYRGFHLAKEQERGSTTNLMITSGDETKLYWERPDGSPDLINIKLDEKLAPNQKIILHLDYIVKIPSNKFTSYGYGEKDEMNLKYWFLIPSRFENHNFVRYNNLNLDDIANAVTDFEIKLKLSKNINVISDLNSSKISETESFSIYELTGKNRTDFSLFLEPKTNFSSFKNSFIEVVTNMKVNKVDDIQKANVIDKVVNFTNDFIGKYPFEKITVSQDDYDRNPFYGLNQLPSFLTPFPDEFLFEIKFLKTYINNYLKNSLRLDPRKDNWIYDGIQIYTMMKYIDQNYPDCKLMGRIADFRLLKSFNLINLDFNEQYSYFYMLMARKNLDQAIGDSKNTLIKFNEQISNKYRAGLSLIYLDDYLENQSVHNSIQQFYAQNKERQTTQNDFEILLKSKTKKDINWFFKTIINSREIVDYKFANVSKTKDSIQFSLNNRTNVSVPMPIFGIKNDSIVFKKWIETNVKDSIYTMERKNADKIVLNYSNEVPEFNLRNNWKKIDGFFPNNRPIKFVIMTDLEDPYYNQILYSPILPYNVYDGLSPGVRLHNKTLLNKPFTFDLNPVYSIKSRYLTGSGVFAISEDYRDRNLFNIRYSISATFFHYAPDATYLKINPSITLQIRSQNFRDNRKQFVNFRNVLVNREKSAIVIDNSMMNYSVFDVKYVNSKSEVTNHISVANDIQFSEKFGKTSVEIQFRKLLENNRQVNLRMYLGGFLYNNTNSDFFSFALDRPTDYLFDYAYLGRSTSTGIVSQEFILAEGSFKSKLNIPFANHWISTVNASYTLWNWVDAYSDLGLMKNKYQDPKFVYDSGVRLNLLTDYFELFFPIYSNNGWEIADKKYSEKIRFVATLDPSRLFQLFTRKWF